MVMDNVSSTTLYAVHKEHFPTEEILVLALNQNIQMPLPKQGGIFSNCIKAKEVGQSVKEVPRSILVGDTHFELRCHFAGDL